MLVGLRPVGRPALFSWSVANPATPRERQWTWGGIHPALKAQTSAPKDGPWVLLFFGTTLGFRRLGLSEVSFCSSFCRVVRARVSN